VDRKARLGEPDAGTREIFVHSVGNKRELKPLQWSEVLAAGDRMVAGLGGNLSLTQSPPSGESRV